MQKLTLFYIDRRWRFLSRFERFYVYFFVSVVYAYGVVGYILYGCVLLWIFLYRPLQWAIQELVVGGDNPSSRSILPFPCMSVSYFSLPWSPPALKSSYVWGALSCQTFICTLSQKIASGCNNLSAFFTDKSCCLPVNGDTSSLGSAII